MRHTLCLLLFAVAVGPAAAQTDGPVRPFTQVGDAVPEPLTASPGDPVRGRAIVANRQQGLCLLCHSGPFPEERFQGNLAPDLAGAGKRWSVGQLRLRIADAQVINTQTIMPPYFRVTGLSQVARAGVGKPLLGAQQVEDVVAYLAGLRD